MSLHQTVEAALKDKAPKLHASLQAAGELRGYVSELASQISSEVVSLTQEQRLREKWDSDPATLVGKLNQARARNREVVMHDLLEFPQDGTSQPSPGATTDSAPTT